MVENLYVRLFLARFALIQPGGWRLRNLQSNFWRLYLNDNDGAIIEKEGELFPLQRGRLYFVPAGVRFSSDLTSQVGHFYVHFDITGLPNKAMPALFGWPISLPHNPTLEETAWQLKEQIEQTAEISFILQCRLKALIYAGLADYFETLPAARLQEYLQLALAIQPVQTAINYIEANLSQQINNRQLARLCQMNEDYFIRRFKECVGQTPGQYIREQRLKSATQQLLFTRDSIEEIALKTGFGNRYYFSRVFSAQFGLAPAAYRKTVPL